MKVQVVISREMLKGGWPWPDAAPLGRRPDGREERRKAGARAS
jgi:hypothetical protein